MSVEAAYDETPYPSGPHPYSHPGHVGMLATLAGFDATPLERCRVLEIGGSDGGNLMPIALDFPDSKFVCLDISSVQIEMGKRNAAELGVKNIEWHVADLSQFHEMEPGKFDYIIAHGVYSWVSREIQDRLLELYARLLSPRGLGFVSYNTYPGWHLHMAMREMMLLHVQDIEDNSQRVAACMDLVKQLAEFTTGVNDPIATLIKSFLAKTEQFESVPVYVTHEFLSTDNSPLYFSEFAKRVADVELQVLCDGNRQEVSLDTLPIEARQWIEQQTDDPAMRGQYVDFFRSNAFRRSILCCNDFNVDCSFSAPRWKDLSVSADVVSADNTGQRWTTALGKTFTTTHELAQSILRRLASEWPRSCRVSELASSLESPVEPVAQILQSMLDHSVVEARLAPHRCVGNVTERPEASRFSRQQANSGLVTTQRHTRLRMDDDTAQRMLPLVDGTRTLDRIAAETGVSRDETTKQLEQMARHALLVG